MIYIPIYLLSPMTYEQKWFSIDVLNYQRVTGKENTTCMDLGTTILEHLIPQCVCVSSQWAPNGHSRIFNFARSTNKNFCVPRLLKSTTKPSGKLTQLGKSKFIIGKWSIKSYKIYKQYIIFNSYMKLPEANLMLYWCPWMVDKIGTGSHSESVAMKVLICPLQ